MEARSNLNIFFLLSLDADYIKFLDTLEETEEKQTIDIEKFLEELDIREKQNQKPIETPLTSFVKQRREERRVRQLKLTC